MSSDARQSPRPEGQEKPQGASGVTNSGATGADGPAAPDGGSGRGTGSGTDAADAAPEGAAAGFGDGRHPCPVVGVGASAGGLDALRQFFAAVPDHTGLAFVVIQHLDAASRGLLSDLLRSRSTLTVVNIEDETPLQPDHVYVRLAETEVRLADGVLHASALTPRGRLAPVDHFFRSLAQDQGHCAVGVVLSGAGTDGTLGLRAIHEAGGMTMAQAPETAKFDSMPRSAATSAVADHILPPDQMPLELLRYAGHIHQLRRGAAGRDLRQGIADELPGICKVLHERTEHDFRHYKQSTMIRRVQRRMQVQHVADAAQYLRRLERDSGEVEALFKELLIGVTAFFRDREAFEELASTALPQMLDGGDPDQPLRIWVPGCATGEEAYSIGMLIRERLDRVDVPPPVQIFATDIDEEAVAHARRGVYPQGIAQRVSPERLRRFFERRGRQYVVTQDLREMCMFSVHNLVSDPPFSRLDLISCRNVLIYLGPHLQKKLIPLFHFALRPGGYLFMGPSESITGHDELFRPVSTKHRLSQRRSTGTAPTLQLPGTPASRFTTVSARGRDDAPVSEAGLEQVAQRIILDEFAPAYAIVTEQGQVEYLSRRIGRFLEPAPGAFTSDLVRMARPGLRSALRAAMLEARKTRRTVTRHGLNVELEGATQPVGLTVQPMMHLGQDTGLFMLVLQEQGEAFTSEQHRDDDEATEQVIAQLESELKMTRSDLEAAVQELEAANEELKSSNEELLSMNEELQSANEELETSKEEVQASNRALVEAKTDLENLLESTRIATIFLDEEGRIRSFTPTAATIYNLLRSDIGRPLSHLTHHAVTMPDLPDVNEVYSAAETIEHEVETRDGRWFARRILPYRSSADRYDGIVVTFTDVTHLKQVQKALRKQTETLQTVNRVNTALAAELDLETLVQSVTDAGTQLSGAQFGAFFYNETDEAGGRYALYTLSGAPREAFEKFPMPRSTDVFGPTFRGEGIVRSDDITKDPRYGRNAPHHGMPEGHLPVRSYLAVPVVAPTGETLGGLFFGHEQPGVFTEEAEHLIAGIAAQAAVAIENARLYGQRAHLAAIIDSSHDAVIGKDLEGTIISWNAAAEITYGYTPEEAVGRHISFIVPDEKRDELDGIMARLRQGRSTPPLETVRVTKAGRQLPILLTVSPVRDRSGKITGASAIARDITPLKQAEDVVAQRARQQAAVAALGQRALVEQDLQRLMDEAVAIVAETIDVEYCKVLELLPGEDELLLRAGVGWREGLVGEATVSTGLDSQAGFTLVSHEPVVVEDLRTEARFNGPPLLNEHGVVSGMSCIINGVSPQPWGVFGAHTTRRRDFSRDDLNFLQAVANVLGSAIHMRHAETALRQSEAQFRLITDALPVLIAYCDADLTYRYCNAAYREWFGIEPGALVGRRVRDVIGEEAFAKTEPYIRAVLRGEPQSFDDRLPYVSGRREVHIEMVPHTGKKGRVIGYYALIEDITERKRAEQAVADSAARLHAVVDTAVDGIITIDERGIMESVNPAAERIFGYSAQEMIGRNVSMLMPTPYAAEHDNYLENYRHTGVKKIIGSGREVVGRRKDGSTFPMELGVSECTIGGRCMFTGLVRDISARKEDEQALHEALEQRRLALSAADLGTWRLELETGHVAFDERGAAIFGFDGKLEIALDEALARVHPDDRPRIEQAIRSALDPQQSAAYDEQYRVRLPNGRERWIAAYGLARLEGEADERRTVQFAGTLQDITERRQAEARITAEHDVSRILAEAGSTDEAAPWLLEAIGKATDAPVGELWISDDGILRRVGLRLDDHDAGDETFGDGRFAPREGLIGRVWDTRRPEWLDNLPERREFPRAEAAARLGLQTGFAAPVMLGGTCLGVLSFFLHRREDPDEHLLNTLASIGRAVGQFIDRRRIEAALRESEQRFRVMANAAPVLIWLAGTDKLCNWFNDRWLQFTGRDMEEELGDRWAEGVHPDDRDRCMQMYLESFDRREPFRMEYRLRRHDGEYRWLLDEGVPLLAPDGTFTGYIGACIDITERRRHEEHVRLLLAELSHRVKNMLTIVQSVSAQTMRRSSTLQEFDEAFRGRIGAMSRLHQLLTRTDWHGVTLRDLVSQTLGAHCAEAEHHCTLVGPTVTLPPNAAQSISMLLHELTTNAVKYGSLSKPDGRLHVSWTVQGTGQGNDDHRLTVEWTERDGPPVKVPQRSGFGSYLINEGLAYELDADTHVEFRPEGLYFRADIPWTAGMLLQDDDESAPA